MAFAFLSSVAVRLFPPSPGAGLPVNPWLERLSHSLAQATFAMTTNQWPSPLLNLFRRQGAVRRMVQFINKAATDRGMGDWLF